MSKAVEDAIKAYLTKVVDGEGYDAPYVNIDDDTLGIDGWFSTSGIAKAAADAARRELLGALAENENVGTAIRNTGEWYALYRDAGNSPDGVGFDSLIERLGLSEVKS